MIFCGDFVYPFDKSVYLKKLLSNEEFKKKEKIVNFESSYSTAKKSTNGIALNSSREAFEILRSMNVSGVSLANNHTFDFDNDIANLVSILDSYNIKTAGAGSSETEAEKPMIIDNTVIHCFGWKVIGCVEARADRAGVNSLNTKHVFNTVSKYKKSHPSHKHIIIFHWNYEFEIYPQPAHRQLSQKLIEHGIDAIIGHHPHVVQGYEIYKGKPIFYSLGNFYIPETSYSGYELKYPEVAKIGLGVELCNDRPDITLYWFLKDEKNNLTISCIEPLSTSQKMKELSPFCNMSHSEYLSFFKKNRKKNKLLPIYKNYDDFNYFNDAFVKLRQAGIDLFVRHGLKKHRKI